MLVRVLGPVGVDGVDDTKLGGPKQRTVLAVLALAGRRSVSVPALVEALWGDEPPSSAVKSVQTYVARLRASLGDHVAGAGNGYRLDLDVDIDAAQRLAQRAAEHRAVGDDATAADLLGRALDESRGASLREVVDTTWATTETARLEELRATWAEERADALLACGRHLELISMLEAMVADEPMRERRWAHLVTALYRSGRQADALRAYARLRALLAEQLGIEPSLDLRALEAAVLRQDPALALAGPREAQSPAKTILTLPSPTGGLIGRSDELSQLGALVTRDDVRLVTITGPGGSGKTRLALELAHSAAAAFPDDPAFVELAPLRDPQHVVAAIAAAVGVDGSALASWLADREMLLVLDNAEHVVDAAADLARLLRDAPRLTMVVTSRRVLRVRGEHVFPLAPLAVEAAVDLFVERATDTDPALVFDSTTRAVTAQICRRVDCLPLAIELAAARTAILTPTALLDALHDGLAALGPPARDAPERHRTLAATLRWSTDLLSSSERRALRRLSVFVGGCPLDAASSVCGASVDDLTALVDSSLVRREVAERGPRLLMLETVREHAANLLEAAGGDERRAVEAAHTEYYATLAQATVLKGAGTLDELRALDDELDDLRVAYDRACVAGHDDTALRIATGLYRYWYLRGLHQEGRERTTAPFEHGAGDPVLRARALRALAGLAWLLGDVGDACARAEQGIAEGTAAAVPDAVLACHTVLGLLAIDRGDFDQARRQFEASGAIASELGLGEDVIVANNNLGELAMRTGDLDEAERRYADTIAYCEQHWKRSDIWALMGLGVVAYLRGENDTSFDRVSQALDLAIRAGNPERAGIALIWLAALAGRRTDHAEAARLLGQGAEFLDTTGGALDSNDADLYEQTAAAARAALGDSAFADLVAEGRSASAAAAPAEEVLAPARRRR